MCELPIGYAAEHLEHGFALTGHAAQGATVRRAFVLLRTEGALAEWAYVACSRARDETRVYGSAPEFRLDAPAATSAGKHASRSLAAALGRSATERLGLAQEARSDQTNAPTPAALDHLGRGLLDGNGRLGGTHARGRRLPPADRIDRRQVERGAGLEL